MIQRRRLTREVSVEGKNFWGFPSRLTFTPTTNGERGWFWLPRPGENPIPINADRAVSKPRRISLAHRGAAGPTCYLHCYEHIGVLRFTGLDGVIVSQIGSFPTPEWPPHFGRAYELCMALSKCWEIAGETIPWISIPKTVRGSRKSRRARYTQLQPPAVGEANPDELCLTVAIYGDYAGVGTGTAHYRIPFQTGIGMENLENIMATHTQGFPRMLFYPSLLASCFGWPHHRRTVWPQEHGCAPAVDLFLAHRLGDLLGALSLMSHTALPALHAVSYLSGHEPDLRAVKQARALIGPDPPCAT